MSIKKFIFPMTAVAAIISACGDSDSAVSSAEDGTALTEQEDTGSIWDSTEVSFASSSSILSSGTTALDPAGPAPESSATFTTSSAAQQASEARQSSAAFLSSATSPFARSSSSIVYDPTSSQQVIVQSSGEAAVYQEAEGDLKLVFSASGLSVENDNGSCVNVDGKIATITCAGNYYLSGTSNDFQVVVAASEDAKVYLNFNNLDLTSASDAPIYVQSADKVFFVLLDGTTNSLKDASSRAKTWSYTKNGSAKVDTTGGVIYSKEDITFKGNGSLTVTGNYNNGIHTTDDLRIKDVPTINVTAKNNALKGKNSVDIEGGRYTLVAKEGDGIKSDEGEDEGVIADATKGIVEIAGGEFSIQAGDDGIQAFNQVIFTDSISTPKVTVKSSGKGIVSGNFIHVNAGILNVTSNDDGIHSNMNIYFNGGETTVSAGDDGVHADSTLMFNAGSVNVTKAVEGFEAWYIIAKGGKTAVVTSDDGWNAAGGSADGSTSSGSQWGGPGGGGAASKSVGYIEVYGGYHYLYAAGNDVDVLDANGNVKMSGGVLILELGSGGMGGGMGGRPGQGGSSTGSCSTNMSGGIIDTDSGISVTGGVLLGFGSQTESLVNCNSMTVTAGTAYGSSNAAFKPSVSGSMVIYSNDVGNSVSTVDVSSMKSLELANGMTYYYK